MNYILNERTPETGDNGFIIGDRFVNFKKRFREEITPHDLTSNTSDSRYILSQSTMLSEDIRNGAWKAMNGLLYEGQAYHSAQGSNQWWKIQFVEKPVNITKIILTQRTSGPNNDQINARNLTLQASKDNNLWIDIQNIENIQTNNGEITVIEINQKRLYKYWRLLRKEYGYLTIGEIEITYLV